MFPGDNLYLVCFEPCWGLRDVDVTASLLDTGLTVFSPITSIKYWSRWCKPIHFTCTWPDFHVRRWEQCLRCISTFASRKPLDIFMLRRFPAILVETKQDFLKRCWNHWQPYMWHQNHAFFQARRWSFSTLTKRFLCLNLTSTTLSKHKTANRTWSCLKENL